MPSRSRVEALIGEVEAGRFVEALETFYASGAATRENMQAPTSGLANLIDKERLVLKGHRRVAAMPGTSYLLDGERVVINWVFEFERHDGARFTLNELAYQRWEGQRIIEEQYYYDPAQRAVCGQYARR
jgi:hypothetical protein